MRGIVVILAGCRGFDLEALEARSCAPSYLLRLRHSRYVERKLGAFSCSETQLKFSSRIDFLPRNRKVQKSSQHTSGRRILYRRRRCLMCLALQKEPILATSHAHDVYERCSCRTAWVHPARSLRLKSRSTTGFANHSSKMKIPAHSAGCACRKGQRRCEKYSRLAYVARWCSMSLLNDLCDT